MNGCYRIYYRVIRFEGFVTKILLIKSLAWLEVGIDVG